MRRHKVTLMRLGLLGNKISNLFSLTKESVLATIAVISAGVAFGLQRSRTERLRRRSSNATLLFCLADVQHHLLVTIPPGEGAGDPGSVVPGGDQSLPRRQGADQ